MSENRTEFVQKSENKSLNAPPKEAEAKVERKNPLDAYIGSEYLSMLENQEKKGGVPAVLFTDIDGTFYRKDRLESSKKLFKELQQENYPMVAVTGNGLSEIEKRIQSGELPYFPIIAGEVGTEIYVLHEENGNKVYKKDEAYEELLRTKGYNRFELAKRAQQMIKDLEEKNPQFQKPHHELQFQFEYPEKEQAYIEGKLNSVPPFRLRFFAFTSSEISLKELITQISEQFPRQHVVIYEGIDNKKHIPEGDLMTKKYDIDVLPTTKGDAVDYIADTTNVGFKVVAGDSGNDLEMLTGSNADVSISVGGAKPEVFKVFDQNILGNEINKDVKEVRDSNGNIKKIYYREIGTGRGPESIAKIFKDVKIMQKASTIEMLKKEEGRKEFQELLKKGRNRQA